MSFLTEIRNPRHNPAKQKKQDARFREHDNQKMHVIPAEAGISDKTCK